MSEKAKEYIIPEGGSLGLLALGDIGLTKWREKRAQVKKNFLVMDRDCSSTLKANTNCMDFDGQEKQLIEGFLKGTSGN